MKAKKCSSCEVFCHSTLNKLSNILQQLMLKTNLLINTQLSTEQVDITSHSCDQYCAYPVQIKKKL